MGARPAGARDPRRVRRVAVDAFHVALLLVAMPLGAGAAAVALLATVAVTASRTLGAIAGVVALILCTGGLSLRAVRGIFRGRPGRWMRRWVPVAVTGLALLLTATVVGVVVFAPGPRATPLAQTADTWYWDLATGSRIAYTLMPAARDVPRPTPVLLVHGGPGAPGRAQQRVMATLADAGFASTTTTKSVRDCQDGWRMSGATPSPAMSPIWRPSARRSARTAWRWSAVPGAVSSSPTTWSRTRSASPGRSSRRRGASGPRLSRTGA